MAQGESDDSETDHDGPASGFWLHFASAIEGLRVAQDQNYLERRILLGPTLDLVRQFSDLYKTLGDISSSRRPIENRYLFSQVMLLECSGQLVRTVLMALRGHLTESQAQVRRAIECCAWARRIHTKPELYDEWVKIELTKPASGEWRQEMGVKNILPTDHRVLGNLRARYQVATKCLHPFRFSVGPLVSFEERQDGGATHYTFFDAPQIQQQVVQIFFWILETHKVIIEVFEEIFAEEIANCGDQWSIAYERFAVQYAGHYRQWSERHKRATDVSSADSPKS